MDKIKSSKIVWFFLFLVILGLGTAIYNIKYDNSLNICSPWYDYVLPIMPYLSSWFFLIPGILIASIFSVLAVGSKKEIFIYVPILVIVSILLGIAIGMVGSYSLIYVVIMLTALFSGSIFLVVNLFVDSKYSIMMPTITVVGLLLYILFSFNLPHVYSQIIKVCPLGSYSLLVSYSEKELENNIIDTGDGFVKVIADGNPGFECAKVREPDLLCF